MINKTLGKYELLEEIGHGGYGTVYRARETVLDIERALKVLHPQLVTSPEFLERFRREAKIAARLDHLNIVPVYELGEDQGFYYLAMKFMPAGSLKDLLASEGRLSFERAVEITHQIALALEYALRQPEKLIHRDIKPGNILFETDGTARLADFGFAKATAGTQSDSSSTSGGIIGTPAYIPPEIWRGQPASPASDVYSLACVFYEMLTGEVLFSGDTPAEVMTKHVLDGPRFTKKWPSDVPVKVEKVLFTALKTRPEDRFKDTGAFLNAIKDLSTGAVKEKSKDVSTTYPVAGKKTRKTKGVNLAVNHDIKNKPTSREVRIVVYSLVVGFIILLLWGRSILAIPYTRNESTTTVVSANPITVSTNNAKPSSTQIPTATSSLIPLPAEIVDSLGSQMLLVPAGNFIMGSDTDEYHYEESPARTVYIDSFYIDKYEVTNAMYKMCVYEGNCERPQSKLPPVSRPFPSSRDWINFNRVNPYDLTQYAYHPVVYVDWNMANIYCQWRGGELPTEAQWEKAARGIDGRLNPWGGMSNYGSCDEANTGCVGDTTPVGNYELGISPYGVYDMLGNVWEWIADWYSDSFYRISPSDNPVGPGTGQYRILRGGSWSPYEHWIGITSRFESIPTNIDGKIGFRCARSVQ